MTFFDLTTINNGQFSSKCELRRSVRAAVRELSAEQWGYYSASVFEAIERTEQWQNAKTVGLYSALGDELPTAEIIERWSAVKRIALPVVSGDRMAFYEYDPQCDMRCGEFGIAEPVATALVMPEELDVVIVPGMAFDSNGGRLGRGKGYYDKYLALTTAYKIGVCTPLQLLGSIPCEVHDMRMDCVITK